MFLAKYFFGAKFSYFFSFQGSYQIEWNDIKPFHELPGTEITVMVRQPKKKYLFCSMSLLLFEISYIVIWLCLTRVGNYQIQEFDFPIQTGI